jgi:hypothetical protein
MRSSNLCSADCCHCFGCNEATIGRDSDYGDSDNQCCYRLIQETRAEKAMEAIKRNIFTKAKIKRNNHIDLLPAREVVPGDILVLSRRQDPGRCKVAGSLKPKGQ